MVGHALSCKKEKRKLDKFDRLMVKRRTQQQQQHTHVKINRKDRVDILACACMHVRTMKLKVDIKAKKVLHNKEAKKEGGNRRRVAYRVTSQSDQKSPAD
jgi:hypothetical protein